MKMKKEYKILNYGYRKDLYGLFECFYGTDGVIKYAKGSSVCGMYESPKDIIHALEIMLRDAKKSSKAKISNFSAVIAEIKKGGKK